MVSRAYSSRLICLLLPPDVCEVDTATRGLNSFHQGFHRMLSRIHRLNITHRFHTHFATSDSALAASDSALDLLRRLRGWLFSNDLSFTSATSTRL